MDLDLRAFVDIYAYPEVSIMLWCILQSKILSLLKPTPDLDLAAASIVREELTTRLVLINHQTPFNLGFGGIQSDVIFVNSINNTMNNFKS